MFRGLLVFMALGWISNHSFAQDQASPSLGVALNNHEADVLHVFPDGSGLPNGRGTVADGELIYATQCIACHGENGRGASAEELVGKHESLVSEYPDKTIGSYWPNAPTLYEYIFKSMPPNAPRSLETDQVYSVVAYLLFLNGIVEEEAEIDAASLAAIEMPNKKGFTRVIE